MKLHRVEGKNLTPEPYLEAQDETREEWKDDGCHEAHKEWEEGPHGKHKEENNDDDDVSDHPGDEQKMFVKHSAQKQEKGEKEMDDCGSDDPKHDGAMMNVKYVKIWHCNVHNLQWQNI